MIKLYNADCLEVLKLLESDSIDLFFTSPPYAERRLKTYGGINENEYCDWFLPIGKEIKRVLKPSGSFFLNIKPHTHKGERSLYVFELVIKLKNEVGFLFIDELCWTKNAFPGNLKNKFKNGFEPIYHFSKTQNIIFNPLACGTPMKPESIARAYRKQCGYPKNGSGMAGMNTQNIRCLKTARPSNVVNVNNVSNQFTDKQLHPATFPEGLCDFFIKSYSNENSIVIDPFLGSGTTGISSYKNNRHFIGIEKEKKYFDIGVKRIQDAGGNAYGEIKISTFPCDFVFVP